MKQPVDGVDARSDRAVQALVGVALLAAFVFGVPWLVPGFAVVLGIGAVGGPAANAFLRAFDAWISPRLPGPDRTLADATVGAHTVRAQDRLAAVILAVASFAFVVGIGLIGWILVIAEAVVAILAATTRVHVGERLRRLG